MQGMYGFCQKTQGGKKTMLQDIIVILGHAVYLDPEGKKVLKETFYPKDKIVSMEQLKKDLSEEMNHGQIPCPSCAKKNTTEYIDRFVCFDCGHSRTYLRFDKKYSILFENGYLARKDKSTGHIEFFHRIFMEEKIKKFAEEHPHAVPEVHHKNEVRTDNRLVNLEVLDAIAHKNLHISRSENKAFETWCEKVYGYVDWAYWSNFQNWLIKKEEEDYEFY